MMTINVNWARLAPDLHYFLAVIYLLPGMPFLIVICSRYLDDRIRLNGSRRGYILEPRWLAELNSGDLQL